MSLVRLPEYRRKCKMILIGLAYLSNFHHQPTKDVNNYVQPQDKPSTINEGAPILCVATVACTTSSDNALRLILDLA